MLGLSLVIRDDHVLLALTNGAISTLLRSVEDAYLLTTDPNDLTLLACPSVDQLLQFGKLLLEI